MNWNCTAAATAQLQSDDYLGSLLSLRVSFSNVFCALLTTLKDDCLSDNLKAKAIQSLMQIIFVA